MLHVLQCETIEITTKSISILLNISQLPVSNDLSQSTCKIVTSNTSSYNSPGVNNDRQCIPQVA